MNRDNGAIQNDDRVNILGIAGSLRSGGSHDDLGGLPDTRDDLMRFLGQKSRQRCANSELALMAALWGAKQEGAGVKFIDLSKCEGRRRIEQRSAELGDHVREADGILISSPVYFGANSCIIQNFIEFLYRESTLHADFPGKIYSGLAVGAKRNGGQETTLIFQMADMLGLGFLGVGNDASTTCQYGGTVVAGNKGAILEDGLGIETCIGTGCRIAQVARIYRLGKNQNGASFPRVNFWILQDRDRTTEALIQPLIRILAQDDIPSRCFRLCDDALPPCKACDRCPNHRDEQGADQCRLNSSAGVHNVWHEHLVQSDVIVPTVYTPVDRGSLSSIYQRFLERTRYLRRGDYALSNRVVIPLIFCEFGRSEHFDLRMISSFLRHNTVVHKPLIGMTQNGRLMAPEALIDEWKRAVRISARLAAGRDHFERGSLPPKYVPLGY